MPFNFIKAGKFRIWNVLFSFKQLSRGLLKVTVSARHIPQLSVNNYRMH